MPQNREQERRVLDALADQIPEVQRTLVDRHPKLTVPDRGAHQQQLAGSSVTLEISRQLPAELANLGIFTAGSTHIGIGRISTGLGCPHAETDADFLGLMVAFRTPAGRRVDFVTINDPTSPTDTPEEFIALLKATADAAGAHGLLASQATLLLSLARHAGLNAPAIALHVTGQTRRTVRSLTAYQQYWTGIVLARDVLGKFTFIPAAADAPSDSRAGRGPTCFTDDWKRRQSAGPLAFSLEWLPFVNESATPLGELTTTWQTRPVPVGIVTFPAIDTESRASRLTALLASEVGANPGNWMESADDDGSGLPATRFTAARKLAYQASQRNRGALPDEAYEAFFSKGEIGPALAAELVRRYAAKRVAGHWVPDVGEVAAG